MRIAMGALGSAPMCSNGKCPSGSQGDPCYYWTGNAAVPGFIDASRNCYLGPGPVDTISAVTLPDTSTLPPPAQPLPVGAPVLDENGNPVINPATNQPILQWATTAQQGDNAISSVAGTPWDPASPWGCRYFGVGCTGDPTGAPFAWIAKYALYIAIGIGALMIVPPMLARSR